MLIVQEVEYEDEWTTIQNGLPVQFEYVLTCDITGIQNVRYIDEDGQWRDTDGDFKNEAIIAWRPLPEPYPVHICKVCGAIMVGEFDQCPECKSDLNHNGKHHAFN